MKELVKELEEHFHAKAVILDISCMEEMKKRVAELHNREDLNSSQKHLTEGFYNFELTECNHTIRSVLLFSFPFPARTLAGFTVNGQIKKFPVCLENRNQYGSVDKELNEILLAKGFHASFMPKLPRKMLAASSGMAKYGRNNIIYVEGQGSFCSLLPFYTDIPTDNTVLYPIERMKFCEKCSICAKVCPNGAIQINKNIIDTEKCLTFYNEEDSTKKFPDWINPKVHNSVIGCEICQINCPQNKTYLDNQVVAAVFDESETAALLEGATYEELPVEFKKKIDVLNINYLLPALPRNLKVLFEK